MAELPGTAEAQDEADELSVRRELYVEAVACGMSFSGAAEFAGVDRSTGWRWRQDPEFRQRVKDARQVTVDRLRAEAERRAMCGSDRLLEFLLCNYDPEKFRPARQRVEISGHLSTSEMSEDEMRAELAALVASGVATPASDGVDDLL